MSIFGFGKKKEETKGCCDCGGACDAQPIRVETPEEPCCCGGNGGCEPQKSQTQQHTQGAAVKVLGSGCAKCNELEESVKAALEELGMDSTIDHVTDFAKISAYGVMTTPALVVDGKVVSFGKVLKKDEVIKILQKIR